MTRTLVIILILACITAAGVFYFAPGSWKPDVEETRTFRSEREVSVEKPSAIESEVIVQTENPPEAARPRDPVPSPPPSRMIQDPKLFLTEWAEEIPLVIPSEWLSINTPLERLVAATNAIAMGENPMRQLAFLRPTGRFEPDVGQTGELVLAADLDTRYRAFLALLDSIDPDLAVEAYQQAEPYLDRAYQNLGYPEGRFRPVLIEAIEVLRITPDPDRPILLIEDSVTYAYADEELEQLDLSQRLLLRLSPEQRRSVDRLLIELHNGLSRLPD